MYIGDASDFVSANPWPVLATLLGMVAALVVLCTKPGPSKGASAEQVNHHSEKSKKKEFLKGGTPRN